MKDASNNHKAMQCLISCIADDDTGNIPGDIDWTEVIKLANLHKVIPRLYLKAKDYLPETERESLRKSFLAIATRNTFIIEELARLTTLFNENDITAMPFKGPALALQIFGDVTKRQFDDIDLIVPSNQIARAVEVLKKNEYQPDIELSESASKGYNKAGQDWTLHTSNSDICLDIKPASNLKSDPEEKEAVLYKDIPIHCLTASDTLEGICVHGNRHLWHRLSWILDVSELIQKLSEDEMESVIASAHKNGTLLRLLLGLNLANEVLKTNLPECVKSEIASHPELIHLTEVFYSHALFTSVK